MRTKTVSTHDAFTDLKWIELPLAQQLLAVRAGVLWIKIVLQKQLMERSCCNYMLVISTENLVHDLASSVTFSLMGSSFLLVVKSCKPLVTYGSSQKAYQNVPKGHNYVCIRGVVVHFFRCQEILNARSRCWPDIMCESPTVQCRWKEIRKNEEVSSGSGVLQNNFGEQHPSVQRAVQRTSNCRPYSTFEFRPYHVRFDTSRDCQN